jgi:hypothetical protein
MLIPRVGTLERIFLDKMVEKMDLPDDGVDYRDFVGTEITLQNIDQIAENLRYGMFDAENDHELKYDA